MESVEDAAADGLGLGPPVRNPPVVDVVVVAEANGARVVVAICRPIHEAGDALAGEDTLGAVSFTVAGVVALPVSYSTVRTEAVPARVVHDMTQGVALVTPPAWTHDGVWAVCSFEAAASSCSWSVDGQLAASQPVSASGCVLLVRSSKALGAHALVSSTSSVIRIAGRYRSRMHASRVCRMAGLPGSGMVRHLVLQWPSCTGRRDTIGTNREVTELEQSEGEAQLFVRST